MAYVDGFVAPIPKKNVKTYQKIARKAGKIWREHGAIQYCEAIGEDLATKQMVQFPKIIKAKPTETVIFAWIVFKSRAHRDKVNAKVMKDPRMHFDGTAMPFDWKKMAYGGFEIIVDA